MKNCYWGYLSYGLNQAEVPTYEYTEKGYDPIFWVKPEDWAKKHFLEFMGKMKDKEYFLFVINDAQMRDFTQSFLEPFGKEMLIYRSEKFNNRNHKYLKNCLTMFIFQKKDEVVSHIEKQ